MTLNELASTFVNFTNEHYGKADLQGFFQLIFRMSLKGMGMDVTGPVAASGEIMAMANVKAALERKYPNQPLTVFDVGANVGTFMASAISTFGTENRRFFGFEPSPNAFAQLQQTTANYPSGVVRTFNFGLGDKEETVPLFADTAGSGWGSVYKRRLDHVGVQINQVEEATLTTIDKFCAANSIDRIHFLKLDIEGHEFKCLSGARQMIDAGRIDYIQFEFGGTNIDSRTFFQDFWYALKNYRIKRILRDGFFTIEKYSEAEELFLAQNYMAELK